MINNITLYYIVDEMKNEIYDVCIMQHTDKDSTKT